MDHEASTHNLLECMLLDEDVEPTDLPISLLKSITNNFSDGLEIGRGGSAVVYKGLLQNGTVAVKKLYQTIDMHEEKFNQEICCLMRLKHKNIVRFLGYCADTQGKMWIYEENMVMADVRQRLICFEFLRNGSSMSISLVYPLKSDVNSKIRTLLASYCSHYTLKNRNLIFASAWH